MLGEFAGGRAVALMVREEGEVITADAAVIERGTAIIAGAEVRFGFGEAALLGEESAESALERK